MSRGVRVSSACVVTACAHARAQAGATVFKDSLTARFILCARSLIFQYTLALLTVEPLLKDKLVGWLCDEPVSDA